MIVIETDSQLDQAADEFFKAAYKYREAMKRHAPRQLGGVLFLRRGAGCIVYSEMERYTNHVCSMTFDRYKDEIIFTEPDDTSE